LVEKFSGKNIDPIPVGTRALSVYISSDLHEAGVICVAVPDSNFCFGVAAICPLQACRRAALQLRRQPEYHVDIDRRHDPPAGVKDQVRLKAQRPSAIAATGRDLQVFGARTQAVEGGACRNHSGRQRQMSAGRVAHKHQGDRAAACYAAFSRRLRNRLSPPWATGRRRWRRRCSFHRPRSATRRALPRRAARAWSHAAD